MSDTLHENTKKTQFHWRAIIIASVCLPFLAVAYTSVWKNATGDHTIVHRWLDTLWAGQQNFMFIDKESPRFIIQFISGYIGYIISFGDVQITSIFISAAELVLILASIWFFHRSITKPPTSGSNYLFVFLLVTIALYFLGLLTPSWAALLATTHSMRHTSAIAFALFAIAMFFQLQKHNRTALSYKPTTIVAVSIAFVLIGISDKLVFAWGLGPFLALLGAHRIAALLFRTHEHTPTKIAFELFVIFGIILTVFLISETLRPIAIKLAGAMPMDGVTKPNYWANIKTADVLLPRSLDATFSKKETVFYVAVTLVCLHAILEWISTAKPLQHLKLAAKFRQTSNYIGTKTVVTCAIVLLISLSAMVITKAINYRYVEFFDILVFLSLCSVIHVYFTLLHKFVSAKNTRILEVTPSVVASLAALMSLIFSYSIIQNGPKQHRYLNIKNWIEDQFPNKEHVYGLAGYWPAHEISFLSKRLVLQPLDTNQFRPYVRFHNIHGYIWQRNDCYVPRKIDFILRDPTYAKYQMSEIETKLRTPDRKVCLRADCQFELLIFDEPVSLGTLIRVGTESDFAKPDQSVTSLISLSAPNLEPCEDI